MSSMLIVMFIVYCSLGIRILVNSGKEVKNAGFWVRRLWEGMGRSAVGGERVESGHRKEFGAGVIGGELTKKVS